MIIYIVEIENTAFSYVCSVVAMYYCLSQNRVQGYPQLMTFTNRQGCIIFNQHRLPLIDRMLITLGSKFDVVLLADNK